MTEYPICFQVPLDKDFKRYYEVFIWRDTNQYRSILDPRLKKEFACQRGSYKTVNGKIYNCFGPGKISEIHFNHKYFGSGIVSHELLHLVFWIYELKHGDLRSVNEEYLCSRLQFLVRKFWNFWYLLEIDKK
jgi:hypothetical protein